MMTSLVAPEKQFPYAGTVAQQFSFLLNYAILAPSGHNTQPWVFRIEGDRLDLLADRTRSLPVVDPDDRALTISCGAALDHLAVAARHYGKDLDIEICPDGYDTDLLARIRMKNDSVPDTTDRELFDAIPKRHTTRSKFDRRELPENLRSQCIQRSEQLGIGLTLITDCSKRCEIADLVAEGDRMQFADPKFRRELASWVQSRRRASRDGMSGAGFGMPDALSPVGAFAIRTFNLGKGIATSDKDKIVEGSPTLAVFSTPQDTVPTWLATGRALSQVFLTLTAAGATASFLNPPI